MSATFTPAARTSRSTSSGPGSGVAVSTISRTSGPPYARASTEVVMVAILRRRPRGQRECTSQYPCAVSSEIPSLADLHARDAAQQPTYPDAGAVDAVVARLRSFPPLVFAGECDELTDKLAAVSRGEAFLLQGGDCAET